MPRRSLLSRAGSSCRYGTSTEHLQHVADRFGGNFSYTTTGQSQPDPVPIGTQCHVPWRVVRVGRKVCRVLVAGLLTAHRPPPLFCKERGEFHTTQRNHSSPLMKMLGWRCWGRSVRTGTGLCGGSGVQSVQSGGSEAAFDHLDSAFRRLRFDDHVSPIQFCIGVGHHQGDFQGRVTVEEPERGLVVVAEMPSCPMGLDFQIDVHAWSPEKKGAPAQHSDVLTVAVLFLLLSGFRCRCKAVLPRPSQDEPVSTTVLSADCASLCRKSPTRTAMARQLVGIRPLGGACCEGVLPESEGRLTFLDRQP